MTTSTMTRARPSTESVAVRSRDGGLKRSTGYATGVILALSGLIFGAAAVATYALRAAGGHVPAEPVFVTVLRVAGSCMLVILGFGLMVLSVRGVEVQDAGAAEVRTEIVSASAGEEILCRGCGAANDYLARFCDQCGRRL
jgi:hypothetical protein